MANPEHLKILKQGVKIWNEWRTDNPAITPDLIAADLSYTDLISADFRGAFLSGAFLSHVDLHGADLSATSLRGAYLGHAYLIGSDLTHANLNRANLLGTKLCGATLRGVTFFNSIMGYTTLGDVDLSETEGLEKVRHHAPSIIGIDTAYKSQGKIPEAFLRGAGVPDDFIAFIRRACPHL